MAPSLPRRRRRKWSQRSKAHPPQSSRRQWARPPKDAKFEDFVKVQLVNKKKFGNVTVKDLCGQLESIRDISVTLTGFDQALVPHPTRSTVGKLLGQHDSGKELHTVCEMVHHLVYIVGTQSRRGGSPATMSNAILDVLKKHKVRWAGLDDSHFNGEGNHRYKDEFKAGNGAVLLMMADIDLPPSLEVPEDLTHTFPVDETAFSMAKRTFESTTYQLTTEGACLERERLFLPTFVGDDGKKWEEREDIPRGRNRDFEQFVKEKGGCKECKRSGVKDCRLSKHNLTVSHNDEATEVKKMHFFVSESGKKYSKSPSQCNTEELREQEEACAEIRSRGEASIDVRCWDHHIIGDMGILSKVIAGVLPIENSPYRNQKVLVNRLAIMHKMKLLLASGVDLSAVSSVEELDMESLQMYCAYSGLPMDSNESQIVDGHHVFEYYNVILSDDGAEYEFATAKGTQLSRLFRVRGDGLQEFIERSSHEASLNTFLLRSVHQMTHRAKEWIANGKMTDVKLPWKIDEERNYIIIDVQKYPQFRRFLSHGRLLDTDVTSPQQEETENANVNLPLVPLPVRASKKRTVDQISSDDEDVVNQISNGDVEDDCLHLATQQQTGNERISRLQNGARLIYSVPTQHKPLIGRQAPRRLIYRAPTQHQPLIGRQVPRRLIYSAPTQHQPLIGRRNGPRLIYSAPTQHQPLIGRQAPRRLIYRAPTVSP